MTDPTPLQTLATFMTAPGRVASHSIGLQIGGEKKEEADRFFELRRSFGVEGYATQKEAEDAIVRTIRDSLAGIYEETRNLGAGA